MTPAGAKAVLAAFQQQALSDADLEKIIASAITRAVDQEREECAFTANLAASLAKEKTAELEFGKGAAYLDMAVQIRRRSHAQTPETSPS